MKKENDFGITLIALVITIIALLILAGITIAMLTGNNGILTKATESSEASEKEKTRERIGLSVQAANIAGRGQLEYENLNQELKNEFGENNYKILNVGKGYLIIVDNVQYKIGESKKVEEGKEINKSNIEYAGDLSKGGKYDGTTEEKAYRINCIEDLVEWSNNYKKYSSSYMELERTLDFESIESYSDCTAITKDINGNEQLEPLIQELTTEAGFKPIEVFNGIFDGKGFFIKNLYEKVSGTAGFIGTCGNVEVKNLGVKGNITSTSNIAGGIIGKNISWNGIVKIENCFFEGEVYAYEIASGIIGVANQTGGTNIINLCYNLGKVEAEKDIAGGILGQTRIATITNCYNEGNIIGSTNAAGILGYSNGGPCIYNCYNSGNIIANLRAGGITSYIYTSLKVKNVYNIGNLKGQTIGGIAVDALWNNPNIIIENSFYLEGTAKKGINKVTDTTEAYSEEKIKSQEFVNELNEYIKNNKDYTEGWLKWKQGNQEYPVFE